MERSVSTGSMAEEARNKRYDRQIRIWGSSGQRRLEAAKVCLLGAGPTGSEALKNLVLGGIGSYTVVDGKKVDPRDLGNNFLVERDSLGKSRAECCSRLLQEFNEVVSARYVAENPEDLIDNKPDFFSTFTIVIATQLLEPHQVKLDRICRRYKIKAIFARSYGLFGSVRLSAVEHHVIEAKPENVIEDLRLHDPWPALLQYVEALDLDSLDAMTFKHVPYIVLLIKAARAWVNVHGTLPEDRPSQKEFKKSIANLQRTNNSGSQYEGENFKEAMDAAHRLWAHASLSREMTAALASEKCTPTKETPKFWILMAALKQFMKQNDGRLPLQGNIPDMTSTTDLYLALKRLYQQKAEEDCSAMATLVRQILESLQRDQGEISAERIALFCKNSRYVRSLEYRPLGEEYDELQSSSNREQKPQNLHSYLSNEDTAENAFIYVLFHAAGRFFSTYNHFPGIFDGEVQEDIPRLKNIVLNMLAEAGLPSFPVSGDYVHELCRCGAGEIHTVAAVVGGIVAEEAIKLVTEQFTPLSGTLIYNAIRSTILILDL